MNYTGLFARSWNLVKENRFLWALGFLTALSGGLLSSVKIGPALGLGANDTLLRADVFDFESWARALQLFGGGLVAATIVTLAAALVFGVAILIGQAGLVRAAHALQHEAPIDLPAAVAAGRDRIGLLIQMTLLLYVPYLLATDILGEGLHLSHGIIRLPIYALLLAMLVAGALLSLIHLLAVCGIVLQGHSPSASIGQAWRMLNRHTAPLLTIGIALGALGVVFAAITDLLLAPVAGVTLLSILLGWLQAGIGNLGSAFGLLFLGALAAGITAPVRAYQVVTLALAYEEWGESPAPARSNALPSRGRVLR